MQMDLTVATSAAWRSMGMFLWMEANATFQCHCYCHCGFGDSVHSGADDWDVQVDRVRQLRPEIDVVRQDVRFSGNQQDIIEGQTLSCKLVIHRSSQW